MSAHVVIPCRVCAGTRMGSVSVPLDEGAGPFYVRCSVCDVPHAANVRDTSKTAERWPGSDVLAGGYEVLCYIVPGKPEGARWRG